MGRINRNGSLSKKVRAKKTYPSVSIDVDSDFASIKIAEGIEAKSYLKDGLVFLEDSKGRVIEIQVLNLSDLSKVKKNSAA